MKSQYQYQNLDYQDLLKIIAGLSTSQNNEMRHTLIMVGGLHGSGKSSLCHKISTSFSDIICVSASELINHIDKSKNVVDISKNQLLLIEKLKNIKESNRLTIVDGHFCLLDNFEKIHYVGEQIFKELSPKLLVLVAAPATTIQQRILERDHICYPLELIEKWNALEEYWAKETSNLLTVPLLKIQSN